MRFHSSMLRVALNAGCWLKIWLSSLKPWAKGERTACTLACTSCGDVRANRAGLHCASGVLCELLLRLCVLWCTVACQCGQQSWEEQRCVACACMGCKQNNPDCSWVLFRKKSNTQASMLGKRRNDEGGCASQVSFEPYLSKPRKEAQPQSECVVLEVCVSKQALTHTHSDERCLLSHLPPLNPLSPLLSHTQ